MPTMRDIAARAQVSTATVSHVINESAYVGPQLRERVLKAIQELNYHPNWTARSLRTKRTKTVGMIIPDISNPFFPAVVRGAEDVLNRAGYTLLIGNSENDPAKEENYYHAFLQKRVDGLLLVASPTVKPPAYLKQHNLEEHPVVYVDRWFPGLRGDVVLADNVGGSYLAVRHMLNAGHRRIGIITLPLSLPGGRLRLKGYLQALQEYGVPAEKELIREGRFDLHSGYEQTLALLRMKTPPTGLFLSNLVLTMGCMQALAELGMWFPRDLAVISFDDVDWFALMRPSITAVAQPAYGLGATGARVLVERLTGTANEPRRRIVLKTELVVRDSCP
jgi:LacI family transcriptional regulator